MRKKLLIGLLCFLIGGSAAFFGVQYFTKTGIFKIPGEVVFADEIPDSETEKYREALVDVELDKNVTISEYYSDKLEDDFLMYN